MFNLEETSELQNTIFYKSVYKENFFMTICSYKVMV